MRATKKYMGVKIPKSAPSRTESAAVCRIVDTLALPGATKPNDSKVLTIYVVAARPAVVVRRTVK